VFGPMEVLEIRHVSRELAPHSNPRETDTCLTGRVVGRSLHNGRWSHRIPLNSPRPSVGSRSVLAAHIGTYACVGRAVRVRQGAFNRPGELRRRDPTAVRRSTPIGTYIAA